MEAPAFFLFTANHRQKKEFSFYLVCNLYGGSMLSYIKTGLLLLIEHYRNW